MKLKIKKDLCIGCGTCVGLDENAFKFNDDGKAICINDPKNIDEVKNSCPVNAIIDNND